MMGDGDWPAVVMLSEVKIKQLLEESLNIKGLNMSDMKKPTKEFATKLFALLLDVVGMNTEETPTYQGHCNYPELYQNSLQLSLLIFASNKVMTSLGFSDFALGDLINPDPKRFRVHVSALVQYAVFYSQKEPEFVAIVNEMADLSQEIKGMEKQWELLKQHKANIDSEAEKEEREEKKVEEECRLLEEKFASFHSQRSKTKEEIAVHEIELAPQLSELNCLKEQEEKVLEQIQRLKFQIVKSPHKLKAHNRALLKEYEDRDVEYNELHNKLEGFMAEKTRISQVLLDSDKVLDMVPKFAQIATVVDKEDKELLKFKDEKNALDQTNQTFQFSHAEAVVKMNSIQESIKRVSVKSEDTERKLNLDIIGSESEFESIEVVIGNVRDGIEILNREVESTLKDINNEEDKCFEEVQDYTLHEKEQIVTEFKEFCQQSLAASTAYGEELRKLTSENQIGTNYKNLHGID